MFKVQNEVSDDVLNRFYIGGEWVESDSRRRATISSPVTEEKLFDVPLASKSDMERAITAARTAFDKGPWPRMTGEQRSAYLQRLADRLAARSQLLAKLWTTQVGAPIAFAQLVIPLAISGYQYYCGLAATHPFQETRPTDRGHARIRSEPVGVVGLILPWNAAFGILSYKLPAALAAGCTCVVKSSPESPLDALIVAECVAEAGIPAGVVNVVTADREESTYLVASPQIDKISFTGSVAAGRQIGAMTADRMARSTLELGGKSAAILLDDVDLSAALPALVPFTMPFSGQVCFSQTRILVPASRLEEFTKTYVSVVKSLKIGDPWDPETQVGPVLNQRQLDRILRYIDQAVEQGARIATGGRRAARDRGFFIEPTVFVDVEPHMVITKEEVFGPVVTIQGYDTIEDAIRIANDSDLGLSGSVFGRDVERAFQVASEIRSGHMGVNGLEMEPSIPFGGYKYSGIGREGGPEGLAGFLETKSVYMPGAA